MRPFLSFHVFFFLQMCLTPDWTACSRMCVGLCTLCVSRVSVYEKRAGCKMAANFLTVCFWFPQQMSVHERRRQRQSICFMCHPSDPSMRWCMYILIWTADIRIEYWSYTHYVQFLFKPHVLVPLQLHKDKPSFFWAVCTSESHIYTVTALSDRSAMFFMFVFYTMALLMKCMLSFDN